MHDISSSKKVQAPRKRRKKRPERHRADPGCNEQRRVRHRHVAPRTEKAMTTAAIEMYSTQQGRN